MKDNSEKSDAYVAASIHRHFYYNETLQSPTLVKEYARVEQILVDANYIACITIQIPHLARIEYQYGSTAYNQLLAEVMQRISEVRSKTFRGDDILVADLFDVDAFMIFLTPPRQSDTKLLDHLESIAERTRIRLEREIFDLFYPYTREYCKPRIGFALAIKNPMVSNMRLISQLIGSAKRMGEFEARKTEFSSKYQLQKLIIEEDVQTIFQPVVDLNTLEVLGYEALSRGPQGTELHSPLLMFLLAQQHNLSFELDALCRKRVFESVRRLGTDKKIFVNTLTMTIHDPEFRGQYLKELLEDMKIKPSNVIFEINEKLAIDNYDLFRSALQDYSDIGIVHANDDIGTGYSDLERIMELNPGFMKIDISLVRDIDGFFIKQEIVKAMVNLSKAIGSRVIAEGIETRAEYRKLKELGVELGQGYLFGRPSDILTPIDMGLLED